MQSLKRFIVFVLALGIFSISSSTFAQEVSGQEDIFTTVKIISYEKTLNGFVYANSYGSATIIREDGLILTNNHVVVDDDDEPLDAFGICFTFKSGDSKGETVCEYTASIVARSEDLDLALMKIHAKDIRGNVMKDLPYLQVESDVSVDVGDQITIVGYPSTGGETITTTKGLTSGFELRKDIQYIKTDTDISGGNSGGTALNEEGEFIGVPTYVRSAIENLGYALDIREAFDWIGEHQNDSPALDAEANLLLEERQVLLNDANKDHFYKHPYYPYFSLTVPKDWKFETALYDTVAVQLSTVKKNYVLSIQMQEQPYEVTDDYLQKKVFEKIEKQKDVYKNLTKEEIEFYGHKGYLVTYLIADTKAIRYLIPYGYSIITIRFNVDLKEELQDVQVYRSVLDAIVLDAVKEKFPPNFLKFERDEPSFEVRAPLGWYILENHDESFDELVLELAEQKNYEGKMSLYYDEFTESEKQSGVDGLLDKVIAEKEGSFGYRLVNKSTDVRVDGLNSFAVTYIYEGDEYQQIRKRSEVYAIDGDSFYLFSYDDIDKNFERNIDDFFEFVKSFRLNDAVNDERKGEFELTSLKGAFNDMSYHRFEREVGVLKDKGVIDGFSDGNFYPERRVKRIEALKMIVLSRKNFLEEQSNMELTDELEQFVATERNDDDFIDVQDVDLLTFVRYARSKGIVEGYSAKRFGADDDVTLAQAMKMIINTYELPIWENKDFQSEFPWYKPYVYKGYELGIIPRGLDDPHYKLTRAEFAAIIVYLLEEMQM